MKLAVSCFILALVLGTIEVTAAPLDRCKTGNVRGFAALRDSEVGMGGMPSQFSRAQPWFDIKYNCTGRGIFARRVDTGTYDIVFPDNPAQVATVSALTDQAASASAVKIDGAFRVSIRGPVTNNNINLRRDMPFYIIIS